MAGPGKFGIKALKALTAILLLCHDHFTKGNNFFQNNVVTPRCGPSYKKISASFKKLLEIKLQVPRKLADIKPLLVSFRLFFGRDKFDV